MRMCESETLSLPQLSFGSLRYLSDLILLLPFDAFLDDGRAEL